MGRLEYKQLCNQVSNIKKFLIENEEVFLSEFFDEEHHILIHDVAVTDVDLVIVAFDTMYTIDMEEFIDWVLEMQFEGGGDEL